MKSVEIELLFIYLRFDFNLFVEFVSVFLIVIACYPANSATHQAAMSGVRLIEEVPEIAIQVSEIMKTKMDSLEKRMNGNDSNRK